MKHRLYAKPAESAFNGAYKIMSTLSDVNHGDIVEISFPDNPTKTLLVSHTRAGGCRGCALDVLEDYCEVGDIHGAPLCMSCAGTKTIFKNLDSIMEDL